MIQIVEAKSLSREALMAGLPPLPDISGAVGEIISRVRLEGDRALSDYSLRFDQVALNNFRVPEADIAAATTAMPADFIRVLKQAAEHIRVFHTAQARQGFELKPRPGLTVGQKVLPIQSVGLYVPGGTASYPSTVLMNAIPAHIAGCPRIAMVSPPGKDGKVQPAILAAAAVVGIQEIYALGGAQAIAALAYGTESIQKVDKIVGPGNAWVAEAKRQVYGQVAIDMVAGPSEILIIADSGARPAWLAADLLSQAEHDALASAILITPDAVLAKAVQLEIERQLPTLGRADIARRSIEGRGRVIVVSDLKEAMALSNAIAPEHLELCLDEPFAWLDQVAHAGSVFLGHYCPEAMGDYYIGCNHTLPTGGSARFASALSVDDFVKKIQYSHYEKAAMQSEARDVALFARQEGLGAHALSAESRLEDDE